MSNETMFNREDFIRLILSKVEHNSSSAQNAKEYLSEEGYDIKEVVNEGLMRIKEISNRLKLSDDKLSSIQKVPAKSSRKSFRKNWSHESVRLLISESNNEDPYEAIKARARDLVFRAFENGWEGPPYSPIKLAEIMGIDVTPNDSVIDAKIVPQKGNKFQILYNPFQIPTRVNFSIAHEIAHTLFSDCAKATRNREENPTENRQLEQLCNAAASEIQLPYAIFSNDANNAQASMKGLIELAKKYKASLESVFMRYTEVIDQPCAILIGIFQDDGKIVVDYYKSSRFFSLDIPESFQIPADSNAYECTSPGWTAEEIADWEIFLGKSYLVSSVGISPYKRDTKPRVGILVLPIEYARHDQHYGKIILEFGDATKPRGKGKKIIAQVVNTSASLGRGFGYSLAKNYPVVKDRLKEWSSDKSTFVLGNTNVVEVDKDIFVFQMLAQKGLFAKGNEIPLRYKELRKCLIQLREYALDNNCSVHMPAIGAGQAGGEWDIIIGMIHDELVNYEIKVNIYLFQSNSFNPKRKSNLTLLNESSTWETKK
ncbi:ImmA/IrrE family metallo-endopeptidase [Sphingobacterium olei]|uniref:ImmA/IrrE family metallo-endopeptidase n=1 Tax=Sphingobacterium olei TaxID=2571155 RepID=A0A4U0P765_9SPHI|nr:ImmA/IrrE family metallo-endopeptidase [Sphingobacterium olei]TJZ63305.1 ImmA/IrrE family metallo-endopeptidase [Sphingobacterium olei]